MGKSAGDFVREIPAKRPVRGKPEGRWLTLWGRSGTGKTMLARAIYEYFPRRASWLDWVGFCRRYQSKEDVNNQLYRACEAEVLVIDDAGAEHQTPATLGQLHGLLQSRIRKWTVITSNLSPDTWRQRDERIGSRLIRDRNVHVDCTTIDYATR